MMGSQIYGSQLAMPLSAPQSTIAIPTLEPIPGSSAPTPSIHERDDGPTPPPLDLRMAAFDQLSLRTAPSEYLTPPEGIPSRRSSLAQQVIPGSYFPSSPKGFSPSPSFTSPEASGSCTPSERPRPAPLTIPAATPDEPLFSAYPDQGPSRSRSQKGKSRNFTFPLRPAFTLAHPPNKRRRSKDSSHDLSGPNSPDMSGSSSPVAPARPKPGRRRASTYSGSPPDLTPLAEPRRHSLRGPKAQASPNRSLKSFRRRRVSIGPTEEIFPPSGQPVSWPAMADEEARRLHHSDFNPPFSYQQPADSGYTLQSVSTVATVRPLGGTPPISPRRSSLSSRTIGPTDASRALLGLSNLSLAEQPEVPAQLIIPEDMVMPHGPPPRRSSLDYGSHVYLPLERKYVIEHDAPMSADMGSVMSGSLTGTETSASADFFSPSSSSKEHPLSSATTSLSRSAKSSKEGGGLSDEKDAALSAIRLQRSLEWEARQNKHRRRLEKRRLILLELVETEIAYTEALKTLVQVYLPQLYALPSVSERSADMVARNVKDLLEIHLRLSGTMVNVLKEENLGYEPQPEPVVAGQLERVSRQLAAIFVENVAAFTAYNEYCAGSIAAATLVRHIGQRPDFENYERRCQIIASHQPFSTLQELLLEAPSEAPVSPASTPTSSSASAPSSRSRLHFRDFLIMPIQRICRYPLLLNQLLGAASTPSPRDEREEPDYSSDNQEEFDVGVDVERALGAMRGVAEEADEARRIKEAEIKSATVLERLEPSIALSPAFIKSLGTCRLIGSLDVLHHHPVVAPLVPPVKVKYMAAFLYRGYLILAKVKKGKVYEAKHYMPLEVFELIDITEGFLPHSIRLSLRDHDFDLAASCESEKEVWSAALCQARDESTIPPFELPASVSPFAARSRRMSAAMPPDFNPATLASASSKRHTLAFPPGESTYMDPSTMSTDDLNYSKTPAASPIRTSFGFTPDRPPRSGHPSTILLRRASATQRLTVDRGLLDVFSESCATARSKAQLHHALFLPDISHSDVRDRASARDSATLRRRRSFLDARQASFDIAFSGEIKGSVMPIRQTRSAAGRRRSYHPSASRRGGHESTTEMDNQSADETATASDFGTLTRGGSIAMTTAAPSSVSISRPPSPPTIIPRRSFSNLRKSTGDYFASHESAPSGIANMLTLSRRKTGSQQGTYRRHPIRAKSVPVSPVMQAMDKDLPPLPPLPSRPHSRASVSVQNSPSRSSLQLRSASRYEVADEDGPVYARGEGFTNQPDRQGAWSSLRRSMSFMRDGSRDSGEWNSTWSPARKRPELSRGMSSDETSNGTGVDSGEADEENSSLGHEANINGEIIAGAPKRKRSVRIFQQLSRFTPM